SGCRVRRLATALENPGMRRVLSLNRLRGRKRGPVEGAPRLLWVRSARSRGGQKFSETLPRLRGPCAQQDKLPLAHKRDTYSASCKSQSLANQVRKERRLPGNEAPLEGLHGAGLPRHEQPADS